MKHRSGRYLHGVAVFVFALLFSACDQAGNDAAGSNEGDRERNVPEVIDASLLRNGRALGDRVRELCASLSTLTNRNERAERLVRISERIDSIDFSGYGYRELASMPQELMLAYEFLSYNLFENGVSEQIVGDFILSGFKKYRKMCFSFGDEKDFSDGRGNDARERRRMARGMRLAWLNDAGFIERHAIRTIFSSNPEAGRRFADRWHREFGYHDERVKQLYHEKNRNRSGNGGEGARP